MDGVDAVLCRITESRFETVDAVSLDYPAALLDTLHRLCIPGDNEIVLMGVADREVAKVFADAVHKLLHKAGVSGKDVRAIGSHGQTIRHQPPGPGNAAPGFTLQIGDPNTLAAETGIDVIADFRRKDIALGGQGAPLAPAFHHAVFTSPTHTRVVLNLGGIANISILPPGSPAIMVTGYDTGPANTLLDGWCKRHTGQSFDKSGSWAASGQMIPAMLDAMLADPYFAQAAPKSTGREYFNAAWLNPFIPAHTPPENVQATLTHLTAKSIADAITRSASGAEVVVCGGGAYNSHLIDVLKSYLPGSHIKVSSDLGIHPQQVEGAAFAWLASSFLAGHPGNIPGVTGATRPAILGTLTPA